MASPYPPGHHAGPRLDIENPDPVWGVDKVKAIFTYGVAAITVIGGTLLLYASRNDADGDLRVVMAGFIGISLNFLYGQEVQTRTARQAATSTAASTAATAATLAASNSGVGAVVDEPKP